MESNPVSDTIGPEYPDPDIETKYPNPDIETGYSDPSGSVSAHLHCNLKQKTPSE